MTSKSPGRVSSTSAPLAFSSEKLDCEHRTFPLPAGVLLDARRAVWLEKTRTLAVADLHLGYAWAQRHAGALLPLSAREETTERLLALVQDYAPRELVLLGDIVHRAVRVAALREELCRLFSEIERRTTLRLVAGNHDAQLTPLLRECGLRADLQREHAAGLHLLLHGDDSDETHAAEHLRAAGERGGRVIIGHEHPAISISDGVATRAKCACFLAGHELLVLPAFSTWAAGTDVRGSHFLSSFARVAECDRAVAIVAGKLLPVRV